MKNSHRIARFIAFTVLFANAWLILGLTPVRLVLILLQVTAGLPEARQALGPTIPSNLMATALLLILTIIYVHSESNFAKELASTGAFGQVLVWSLFISVAVFLCLLGFFGMYIQAAWII